RPYQIALDAAVALRRRNHCGLARDPAVVFWNLDRPRVVWPQHLEECCCRHAAGGKLLRTVEKIAAAEPSMHVLIKQAREFLREVRCLFPFHETLPSLGHRGAT